jgi:hypothetical protein
VGSARGGLSVIPVVAMHASVKGPNVNADVDVDGLHRSRGSIPPSGSIPDDPLGDTQGGRPRLAPKETPRVDARVSLPNPQDPPNPLRHIPIGFESNVILPLCPLIVCASGGAAFRPRFGEQCYGKCDACLDAFASAHKALLLSEMSSGGAAGSP